MVVELTRRLFDVDEYHRMASQYRDRVVKLPRYALAGIPEVWIVDLAAGLVDVHREPLPAGYRLYWRLARWEDVAPVAFPDVVLAVDDILG